MTALADAYGHCEALVRRDDPDRWLASLFVTQASRGHAHALLAFDAEIVRVREAVSEAMLGEIRLQWWRDAVTSGKPAGNPVAVALLDTIERCRLDAGRLLALIEAHAFDLYDDPMLSVGALDGYLRNTGSTLFEATAAVLAPGFPPSAATDAAGRAYALTGLIRTVPYQVMRGQLFIPLDVLARFQLPPGEVLAHRMSPALGLVINDLIARVRVQLAAMDAALPDCPAPEACLPAYLCELYLRRLQRPGFDLFKTPVAVPRLQRLWTLWRAARRL